MSEYLFIRPTLTEPRSYTWFSYDDVSKNVLASGEVSSLYEFVDLNASTPNRSVVLLYPANALKFKTITYPGKLKKSAMNALLYVIEDEFAEDIDNFSVNVLHHVNKDYEVLIYKTEELRGLENALTLLGFSVDVIVPDVLALPTPIKVNNAYEAIACKLDNEWLFRDGPNSGFALSEAWLDVAVEKIGIDHNIISLTEVPEKYKGSWSEELTESVMNTLAVNALASKCNLSSKHRKKNIQYQFLLAWAKVVVLAVLIIGFWVVNANYRTSVAKQEAMAYRNAQRSLLAELIPSARNSNDPLGTFNQQLAVASPIGTAEGYIDLLNMISPVLTNTRQIEMVSLSFNRSRRAFTVQFLAPVDFNMERFQSSFGLDFVVTPQQSKPSRDKMLHSVQLRRMK